MTRQHAAGYTPPEVQKYEQWRCPDCTHLRYQDERPGDPCRWCGPACPEHAPLNERTGRGEAS